MDQLAVGGNLDAGADPKTTLFLDISNLPGLDTALDVIRKGKSGFDIGLFYELLSSLDVLTGKRIFDAVNVPAGSRRQRLVVRSLGDAVIGDPDYRFPVDGVKERFPEVFVAKRLLGGIELEYAHKASRTGTRGDEGFVLDHVLNAPPREQIDPIESALLEVRELGLDIGIDLELDPVEVGQLRAVPVLLPVVVEGFEVDVVAFHPLDEFEGTGTDGLVGHVSLLVGETIDNIGVLADSATTTAEVLEAMAGEDPSDERTAVASCGEYLAARTGQTEPASALTIGVPSELNDFDTLVAEVVGDELSRLEAVGGDVRPVSINRLELAIPVWLAIGLTEFREYVRSNTTTDEYGDRYYNHAQRARRLVTAEVDDALSEVDVLATPTVPRHPPTWDEGIENLLSLVPTMAPFNLTGHPAISVPCGQHEDLSVGLQVVGNRFDEEALFRVAAHIEQE